MSQKMVFLLAFSLLLLAGCTWVKPTAEGEKVRVLEAKEVTSCKSLGSTTATLADKVVGIKRKPQKVKKELETLARNSAADLGGDTIVATSEVVSGKQSFAVYRCVGVAQEK